MQEHPTTSRAPILIAAQSGRMRDSLCLLIGTLPEIDAVGCADESASALRMISTLCPVLVILDTNLPGEDITTLLRRIKGSSQAHCLVLTDTQRQQQDALAAGADVALIKGYPTTRLFETIQRLTAERQVKGPGQSSPERIVSDVE